MLIAIGNNTKGQFMKRKNDLGAILVFAGIAAVLWTPTNAGEKKNSATTPMNRDGTRHRQFLQIAKKGDVDVLFLGDSITQGWNNNKTWKKYFTPLKAANFGISGDDRPRPLAHHGRQGTRRHLPKGGGAHDRHQ